MRIGSQGLYVQEIQKMLAIVLNKGVMADGVFGPATEKAVMQFQEQAGIVVDGIVGTITKARLVAKYMEIKDSSPDVKWWLEDFKPCFIAFIDRGHEFVNNNGNYLTPTSIGKKWHFEGAKMHDGKGWFYEGVENHIVAERLILELQRNTQIQSIRTYSPQKYDTLTTRALKVQDYLEAGYWGIMQSIHSNAAPTQIFDRNGNFVRNRTKEELDDIRGYSCFTTIGQNFSDKVAEYSYEVHEALFPEMKMRTNPIDGDKDHEANFTVLSKTDLPRFKKFGSILHEFDFYTSEPGCNFIMESRDRRVIAMKQIFEWAFEELEKN